MKSGTSYWTIPFVIHNLLTFALVIGLQNHLLYKLTKSVTAVAVAIPQSQTTAVGGATVAFVESFQFNAFDTTRSTFASSSSSLSSSSFEGAGGTQMSSLPTSLATSLQPLSSSSSSSSSAAYPTSISTTSSGFHNSKTSRIMSNLNSISSSSIYPLGPTISTPTANQLHTTFRFSSNSGGNGAINSKFTSVYQSSTLDSHTATTMGLSSSALPSFKNFMKPTNTHSGSSSGSRVSSSNSATNGGKQQFPLDFTFSKNHWTNSDAAFTGGGGVDGGAGGGGGGSSISGSMSDAAVAASGSGNFRLGSSSTSSLSSASSSLVSETERPRIFRNRHHHDQYWGPFFEEASNSTTSGDNSITTAHLYTEAVLNCRVGMLKDKTVMWVRRTSEKVSLLTVGNVTYSSDPRIRVKFQYPNNWRLLINPTQWDDAGIYMCQVSTHPPRVFTTNLTVIEPPLRLIDDQERDVGDRYYKTGSTIDLQCQVSRSFLYKEKQNILKSLKPLNGHSSGASSGSTTNASGSNFSNSNGGSSNQTKMSASNNRNNISNNNSKNNGNGGIGAVNGFASAVNGQFPSTSSSTSSSANNNRTAADQQSPTLEKQFSNLVFWSKDDEELPPAALKRLSSNDKWLTSRVTITDAKLSDSGNYSCSIGRLFTAIVQVQVLTGELPAAVQHNSATALAVCNIRSLRATTGELMLMHLWCWRWRCCWGWLIYFATACFCDYCFVMNAVASVGAAN